jgi:HlyD family secretion protein
VSRPRLLLGVGAVLVVVVAAGLAEESVRRRAGVRTTKVTLGVIHEQVIARATAVPVDGVAHVRARTEGRVLRVLVHEGDIVKKGELLAEIDPAAIEATVAEREAEARSLGAAAVSIARGSREEERVVARSEVAFAREQLALAKEQAARLRALFASGSTSKQDSDEAERHAAMSESRLVAAEARRKLAEEGGSIDDVRAARERGSAADLAARIARIELEDTRLVAPIDGTVLARRIDPGDTVNLSTQANEPASFEIADVSRTEVRIELEESDATRVKQGCTATVTTAGGDLLGRGSVARLSSGFERRMIGGDSGTQLGPPLQRGRKDDAVRR